MELQIENKKVEIKRLFPTDENSTLVISYEGINVILHKSGTVSIHQRVTYKGQKTVNRTIGKKDSRRKILSTNEAYWFREKETE
jgi:hypothetical protein